MLSHPIVVRNNFQEGFGHYKDKIRHLKYENKWEGFGTLNSNGLEI